MYQILLADDETIITTSLQKSIDWEKYDAIVAGIASNGNEAMEIIRNRHIDIVITDIRMQQLSGLELCRLLHKEYPDIQVIIISGYAEFSYAQKAIKYNIVGYCLKPIEFDEICSNLTHAIQRLRKRKNYINQDDFLDALQNNNYEQLSAYLHSRNLNSHSYYCAVLSCDNAPAMNNSSVTTIRLGRNQFALISTSVISEEIIEELFSQSENCCRSHDQDYSQGCHQDNYQSCRQGNNPGYCLGIVQKPIRIEQLQSSIKKCQLYASQYFIQDNSRICDGIDESKSHEFLTTISSAISSSDAARVVWLLQELLTSDIRNSFSVQSAIRLNNKICSSFSHSAGEEEYYLYSIHQMLERYRNFDDLLYSLMDLCNQPEVLAAYTDEMSNSNFLRIAAYLNQNYNKELSLNKLGEHLNLTPSYLSFVFKKESGVTITKYLTNLRIQKAKQLLDAGNLSITDIAVEVGYNDYFYFLKTFKKITGITPTCYRTVGRRNG